MVTAPVDRLFRKADGIILISNAVRDALFTVGNVAAAEVMDRLWVVPDGRDLSHYGGGDRLEVHREFGWGAEQQVVGMVARITPMKGQEIFLQMAALIADAIPTARFLLIGAPWGEDGTEYQRRLQQLVYDSGLSDKVVFTGYRDDIPRLLAGLDCFVHPSQRGAFVSVLIEAMASGIPIASSDVDGIPECVGREGAAALITPITPAGFADAVLNILRNPELAAGMGSTGRKRARRYDISQLARETATVFDIVWSRSQVS